VSAGSVGRSAEGLLLIDKPQGMTSHDAVTAVRRALATKKVGHAGTLDPMATGLLAMGVGRATRLLRYLGQLPKTYEGTLRLGMETSTLDAEGEVTRTTEVATDPGEVRAAMTHLVGVSRQQPPAYSAVKVGGRKLYDAARAGVTLDAEPREVRIEAFDLVEMRGSDVDFRVVCSGGTYVRVLAADVGSAVGCGAHLIRLRRRAIGPFEVAEARPPDAPGDPLPVERAVAHLPRVDLEHEEAVAAGNGRVLAPVGIAGPYAVFDLRGRLIGVYRDEGTKAHPEMILASEPT
jgi:tRNA pseudouridine55 synthase